MSRIAWSVAAIGLLCSSSVAQKAPLFARSRRDPVVHPAVNLAPRRGQDQTVRVWVFFTDKGIGTTDSYRAALAAQAAAYSPRAIQRRTLRRTLPGLFDHHDLPLADGYVAQVLATGVGLRTKSEWLNAVSVEATVGQINALAGLPFVRLIKPLARSARIDPEVKPIVSVPQAAGPADFFYGNAAAQLNQINIPAAHDAGYTGQGIIIGILDTGFNRTHEAFHEPGHELDMRGEWDFINDDGNTGPEEGDHFDQHRHGTLILGTIGGYKPKTFVGGAYDAAFYLAKTEDVTSETPIEEDYYVQGLQWLEGNGADVVTSSLGYIAWYTQDDLDGETAVTTIAMNIATANGLVCCTAAGNYGHDGDPETSSLIAPADAFQVLTCGAVASDGSISSFSSDGPSADGRVKPELLALGSSTATVDPNNDTNYVTASGTSLSTPLVACAAALVVQAHPDWSVAQVRSALFRTASDFVEHGTSDAMFIRGFGIIDVMAAIGTTFIGDLDEDGDTDLIDWASYQDCFSGPDVPPTPECEAADLDEDNDVDVDDFSIFLDNFTGKF